MIWALSQRRERTGCRARVLPCCVAAAILLAFAVSAVPGHAAEYPLAPGQKAVGEIVEYVVQPGEGLNDIARKFDVGYTALAAANPGVDQFTPGAGRKLIIPSLYVLPDVPRQGIAINLAQWRLFYFPPGGDRVETYPLGLGTIGKTTPLGASSVVRKEPNPTWYPPASIRAEHRAEGDELPALIPPGPNNPLGQYALHLGWKNYLIHGTNKPDGVGRNVSHGCIRMYPQDIERLFGEVSVGVPVRTVNQPATAGWSGDGGLYVMVFPSKTQVEEIDIDHPVSADPARGVDGVVRAAAASYAGAVDWDAVLEAAQERTGMPVLVADRSGVARREIRRDYGREAVPSSYSDRGSAARSYDANASQPAYDRETAESYLPYYGSDAPSYGRGPAQSYVPYDRDDAPYRPSYGDAEQWGSPPTPDGTTTYQRYAPYPWRNAW